MGGELSRGYIERTRIMSYNNFFGWIGGAVVHKINTLLFFAVTAQYANALLNPEGYRTLSISNALVIMVVLFLSAWFTQRSHTDASATGRGRRWVQRTRVLPPTSLWRSPIATTCSSCSRSLPCR